MVGLTVLVKTHIRCKAAMTGQEQRWREYITDIHRTGLKKKKNVTHPVVENSVSLVMFINVFLSHYTSHVFCFAAQNEAFFFLQSLIYTNQLAALHFKYSSKVIPQCTFQCVISFIIKDFQQA